VNTAKEEIDGIAAELNGGQAPVEQ